ncbi:MAG: restriction endonuclease subunit S [Deltaproteobacteria bacterium]|nr:restriction endonuclease subunit S [Deltaproteobacteria bacterium]
MAEQVSSLKTGIKYKDTPIGKIPVDWELLSLEDVCDEVYRYPTYYNIEYVDPHQGVPEIRGELIKGNGELSNNMSEYRYIAKETSLKFPKTILHEGDFVLSVRGTMGKIGYISNSLENANMTANLMRISPNHNKVYPLWMKQFLLSDLFQKRLNDASSATTIKTIKAPELKALEISLPPLPEQKKIAEILTTVDDAIEKTAQIIENTKEAKKGLMQRLLIRGIGHQKFKKTEIGEIPEEWEVKRLGDLCDGKPEYGANVAAIDRNDRLPRYIRITDVTEDGKLSAATWQSIRQDVAGPYLLNKGDFLFARSGATVGKTYLYREEDGLSAFAGYMIRFRPNPTVLLPEFLFHYTHSILYYNWVKGILRAGAQPNINGQEYANMPIIKPTIGEQKQIVDILNSLDEDIKKESSYKDQLESLKKGLMQVLLTGKVRVNV